MSTSLFTSLRLTDDILPLPIDAISPVNILSPTSDLSPIPLLTLPPPLTSKPPASLSSLPPETLHEILSLTLSPSKTIVLDSQFSLSSHCPTCTSRSLSLVSRSWSTVVRELRGRTLKLGDGEGGEGVRGLDASLRSGEVIRKGGMDFMEAVGGAAEAEQRKVRNESARQLLLDVLGRCTLLRSFDADFGFYQLGWTPCFLPASIRTLTMRNSEPAQAFGIIACLPLLEDLTLRLVLDWYLPPTSLDKCKAQLSRFELSITGWGETDCDTIDSLLAGSHSSLRSLTLRNKAAASIPAFLPVARYLIGKFGDQLKELSIEDVPNYGRRGPTEKPLQWFPSPTPPCSQLLRLQLTGVDYPPTFFVALGCTQLDELVIEDFDSSNGSTLLQCLEGKSTLAKLRSLSVCTKSAGWEEGSREKVERKCEEKGIALMASWRLGRLESHSMW